MKIALRVPKSVNDGCVEVIVVIIIKNTLDRNKIIVLEKWTVETFFFHGLGIWY